MLNYFSPHSPKLSESLNSYFNSAITKILHLSIILTLAACGDSSSGGSATGPNVVRSPTLSLTSNSPVGYGETISLTAKATKANTNANVSVEFSGVVDNGPCSIRETSAGNYTNSNIGAIATAEYAVTINAANIDGGTCMLSVTAMEASDLFTTQQINVSFTEALAPMLSLTGLSRAGNSETISVTAKATKANAIGSVAVEFSGIVDRGSCSITETSDEDYSNSSMGATATAEYAVTIDPANINGAVCRISFTATENSGASTTQQIRVSFAPIPTLDVDIDNDGLIEIDRAADLQLIHEDLTGTSLNGNSNGCGNGGTCKGYELLKDLDLSDIGNWEPIGVNSTNDYFTGDFDGNGYTISNVSIDGDALSEDGVGFFGAIANSEIRNLNLIITKIDAYNLDGIGGLVGVIYDQDDNKESVIKNSTVTATNISGYSYVGGLVGQIDTTATAAIISSSARVTNIRGKDRVGGLVGFMAGISRISFSKAIVDSISSNSDVGGLIGNDNNAVTIVASLATTGNITGGTMGGLVGYIAKLGSRISSSYVVTRNIFTTTNSAGGALFGQMINDNIPKNTYWDNQILSHNLATLFVLPGTSQSTAQLQQNSTAAGSIYAEWAKEWCNPITSEHMTADSNPGDGFIPAWDFGETDEYPALACSPVPLAEQRRAQKEVITNNAP